MEEEEVEDLFDWAADIYQSDNWNEIGDRVDLTQYEVRIGSIFKEPTGEERLASIEVTKKP